MKYAVRYDEEGGTGYDIYSGERARTTVLQHWGGHQMDEGQEGDKTDLTKNC